MHIFELFDPRVDAIGDEPDRRFSPDEDHTKMKMTDTRKTRLTLRHINKLRTMNELRAVEMEQKIAQIQNQYKVPVDPTGGL